MGSDERAASIFGGLFLLTFVTSIGRYSETLALSWVASWIVKSTIIAVGATSLLSVVTLHKESGADPSVLLVQAESMVAMHVLLIKGFKTPRVPVAGASPG